MEKRPIPKAPGRLDRDGKLFYRRLSEYLSTNDLIQDIDSLLVYQAAKWWEIYMISVRGVEKNGTTVVYSTGHQQVSPDISNMTKANAALAKLLDKLGVGESARQKLKMGTGGDDSDPMDDI